MPSAQLYFLRLWQPGYGPKIVVSLLSDLDPISPATWSDLRAKPIFCVGSGSPSSSTLIGSGYALGDTYLDTTANALWACSTAGSASTSAWTQISAGSGGSSALQQFKVSYDGGDWWGAYSWDGTSQGTTLQKIVKPYKLRAGANGILQEVIGGVTYTYLYGVQGGANTPGNYYVRSVWGSDSSESDVVIPSALTGDIIYAAGCASLISGLLLPALSVSLVAGGTGYYQGELLTVSAATGAGGTPAQITVNTTSAPGAILTCSLTASGEYSEAVPNPVTATGSQGTGASFDLTLQQPLLDVNADGRAWAAE